MDNKNKLLQQIEDCSTIQERTALNSLLSQTREKLRKVRKSCKARIRRAKVRAASRAFVRNPTQAGKDILHPKSSARLTISMADLDRHKESVLADPMKSIPLEPLEGLPDPPPIKHKFSSTFVSFDKFRDYLRKCSSGSSPGLNMIPYKVYKQCTELSFYLFNILRSCYKAKFVPINWRAAREIYIPKASEPKESSISDFRSIALLNVEGKIFFGLLARRLFHHIVLENKFINTSMQKGCMEKTPGCWEHMSMVWSSLKDARLNQKDVSTIWLDIANAYGSIPHQLIFLALRRYGVSDHYLSIIGSYFEAVYSKSFSESCPSSWHQQHKGIFAGCTISIILFLSGINLVIEYTVNCTIRGYISSAKQELPLVRAFMDDMNLMAGPVKDTQVLLTRCTTALTWARMRYNISKSRSFVVKRGKVLNTRPFALQPDSESDIISDEDRISSIHSKAIQWLGRLINGFLSDRRATDELRQKVLDGLSLIDKSFLKGGRKLWINQMLFVPCIRWPISIYEISFKEVQHLERLFSVKIRKWLGLHQSTTNLCLYSNSSPIRLPVKSLTSIFKASKVSGLLQLRDSKDTSVRLSCPRLETGSSWNVREAVNTAECRLRFQEILGHTQTNKAGLGRTKMSRMPCRGSKEHRKLISDSVVEQEGETDFLKAADLLVQCQWVKWKSYVQNNLRWRDILGMPPNLLQFCLGATYNVLPSASNLVRWHQGSDPSCPLCHKAVGTIIHSLTCCQVALDQGRITFRHDSVLNRLISRIKDVIISIRKKGDPKSQSIKFVPEGTRVRNPPKSKSSPSGLLHFATDWKILFDLGTATYVFPSFLSNTQDRPDICLFSVKSHRVILIELTCPREENMEDWNRIKSEKYATLCDSIKNRGWIVSSFAIEVGARGYCARNIVTTLLHLGFTSKAAHATCNEVSWISMQASFCIWLASNSHEWAQPPLVGTHENPVENQRIKSTELNTCNPTATVKQTLLPSKSVLSLVPSSQSLDSTPFVAKANPDSPVVADPDKPHSSKRDANARSEASFPHSPKSKEISAPSTGKIRTGRKRPAGLVNIGNTCYANSLLQAFRCIPEFLSLYELHPTLSTDFSESLLSTLRQIKSKSEIFTPHAFLKSLKVIVDVIANLKLPPNRPRYDFNFNRQHDAADILNYIFRDLTGVSSLAKESIETKLQVSHVCNKCFAPVTREESYPILTVPMAPTVEEAINKHLADEYLFGKNKAFCDQCGRKRVITIETRITHAPDTLVVQMQRFTDDHTRDLSIVNVFPDSLTVKAVSDGLIIKHKYNLRATVNHIGSLTAGHYWSYVALSKSTWLKCDDDRVTEISKRELNNNTSYLFFFSRLGCFPS